MTNEHIDSSPSDPSDSFRAALEALPPALAELKSAITKKSRDLAKTQQAIEGLQERADAALVRALLLAEEASPKIEKSVLSFSEVSRLADEGRGLVAKLQSTVDDGVKAQAQLAAVLERARADADEVSQQKARTTATADEIDSNGQTIVERSKHIEQSREHADSVRTKVDKVLTESQANLSQVASVLAQSQNLLKAIEAARAQAEVSRTNIDDELQVAVDTRDEIKSTLSDAQETLSNARQLVDSAREVEAKNRSALTQLAQHEASLKKMEGEFESLRERIEKLLPGATAALLATEFTNRAKEHKPLKTRWQFAFLVSLALILGVALWDWYVHSGASVSIGYDELLRRFLNRLPVVTPLAIAAWYSAIRAAQARQLEEEYAFKAATAASFDGFAKMMGDMHKGPTGESTQWILASNVLRILAASPQRIFHRDQSKEMPTGQITSQIAGMPAELLDKVRTAPPIRAPE